MTISGRVVRDVVVGFYDSIARRLVCVSSSIEGGGVVRRPARASFPSPVASAVVVVVVARARGGEHVSNLRAIEIRQRKSRRLRHVSQIRAPNPQPPDVERVPPSLERRAAAPRPIRLQDEQPARVPIHQRERARLREPSRESTQKRARGEIRESFGGHEHHRETVPHPFVGEFGEDGVFLDDEDVPRVGTKLHVGVLDGGDVSRDVEVTGAGEGEVAPASLGASDLEASGDLSASGGGHAHGAARAS